MSKMKIIISPDMQTLKPPPLTGDAFVDGCFAFDFIPCPDDRTGSQMEGLKDVPGLVKQGLLEDAWTILDKHHQTIKDLDFIYAFKALILQKSGQFEAAEKTLLTGLKFGRGKFLLYERLGFLSFETGRLNEAVTWWIKSIAAMAMLNRVTMWEPFLYLASVAKALSSETCFRIFMARVREISPHGELSLDDNALKRLDEMVPGLSAPSILKAMDVLCLHYLHQPDSRPAETDFPQTRYLGHPNDPAAGGYLPAFNKLFGEDKKKDWINRLAVTVIILALILFFLQFLKSPEEKQDFKTPKVLPEISQRAPSVEKAKIPLPDSAQDTIVPVKPKKPAAVEIEQKEVPEDAGPAEDSIPIKRRSSFLKSKTKAVHPDIKGKD